MAPGSCEVCASGACASPSRAATVSKVEIVQSERGREVTREVAPYNLDAIIVVGPR